MKWKSKKKKSTFAVGETWQWQRSRARGGFKERWGGATRRNRVGVDLPNWGTAEQKNALCFSLFSLCGLLYNMAVCSPLIFLCGVQKEKVSVGDCFWNPSCSLSCWEDADQRSAASHELNLLSGGSDRVALRIPVHTHIISVETRQIIPPPTHPNPGRRALKWGMSWRPRWRCRSPD